MAQFRVYQLDLIWFNFPDSKVHGANMGPIWGRQDPGGPHVGPMNLAIWVAALIDGHIALAVISSIDMRQRFCGAIVQILVEYEFPWACVKP